MTTRSGNDVEGTGNPNLFRERVMDEQVAEDVQLLLELTLVFALLMQALNWRINNATYYNMATSLYAIYVLFACIICYLFGPRQIFRNAYVRLIFVGLSMYTCVLVVEIIT